MTCLTEAACSVSNRRSSRDHGCRHSSRSRGGAGTRRHLPHQRHWSGYVSIQQKPPYDAASGNDRFGTMRVDHCGISVAYVLTMAGMQFGIDYPEGIQYSPLLCNQIVQQGYDRTPQPGCIGVIDWTALGMGQCWASDHVVLVVDQQGDTFTTWETNTTADGRAYYYTRHRSLFTAFGMPKNLHQPIVAPPVVVPSIDTRRKAVAVFT